MCPAGRPRTFDREEALRKAMLLFWEKGYEGTTMSELVSSIGMKAPSVYAAFGNKDSLFNEVVQLYTGIVEAGPLKALRDADDIRQALADSLAASVRLFTSEDNPSSCLIMSAAINCAPEHSDHVVSLRALRAEYKQALAGRFRLAQTQGQLLADADPQALAEFYTTLVHGLALRARDGSSQAELQASCSLALSALQPLLQAAKPA